MDERKRRLPDQSGPIPKKHLASKEYNGAVVKDSGSPQENGITDQDELTQFQKEAIWRQMQEYRRQFERAQSRIQNLETSETSLTQKLAAVDAAWTTLITDLDLIAQREGVASSVDSAAKDSIFLKTLLSDSIKDPTSSDIQVFIEKYSTSTKTIVTRMFNSISNWLKDRQSLLEVLSTDPSATVEPLKKENASLTEANKQHIVNLEELQARCHSLQKDAQLFRNDLALSKRRLNETLSKLEDTNSDLLRVEKQLDRLRSQSVQKLEAPLNAANAGTTDTEHAEDNVKEVPSAGTGAGSSAEVEQIMSQLEDATKLCEVRLKEIENVRTELVKLQVEYDQLQVQLSNIPDDKATDTNAYRQLYASFSALKSDMESLRPRYDALVSEVEQLKTNQKEFSEQVTGEANTSVEELKSQLAKLETDVRRLRSQREDLQSDLAVRTQKEKVRLDQIKEIKTLADSRAERIKSLISENERLRMKIAAASGDSSVDSKIVKEVDAELSLIEELEKKLAETQSKLDTLQTQLSTVTTESSEKAQIAELGAEIASLKDQLEKSEKTVNELKSCPTSAEDQAMLISSLKGQCEMYETSSKMLVSEIESLGKAWAALEEQNKNKVLDLTSKEEHLLRLSAEKAKADQKYFAVMKAKDAAVTDAQVLRKAAKKQSEVIERLTETERNLSQQLSSQEKELSLFRQAVETGTTKYNGLLQQHNEALNQLENARHECNKMNALLKERTEKAQKEESLRQRSQEQIGQLEKQLSKHKKAEATASPELAEELEKAKKTLRCSACNLRFFSHCITRCMHLCCKACIDKRLETRQRKCPICAEPFGAGDVRQVYF